MPVVTIYPATVPPLKSIVKNAINVNSFLYLKSFLESGYAYSATTNVLIRVPTIVTKIVTPYALKIVSLDVIIYL
jgi:hypothetical protein